MPYTCFEDCDDTTQGCVEVMSQEECETVEGMYTPECKQVCPMQPFYCLDDCDPNPKPD
jgi:hypothetical protein